MLGYGQKKKKEKPKNNAFIKRAHFLDFKEEMDKKDLDSIVEDLEKIENQKEKKEHYVL